MGNRKAFTYTLFAIIFVSSLIYLMYINKQTTTQEVSMTEKIRADEMHFLVKDMITDFKRSIVISFRRALVAVINKEVIDGLYLSDTGQKIIESAEYGTIDGEDQEVMKNNTLIDWNTTLTTLMSKRNLIAKLIIYDMSLSQDNPFYIKVSSRINVSVKDSILEAMYEKSSASNSFVSIKGMEDPFFTIETIGYSKNYIKPCSNISGLQSSKSYLNGWCYKTDLTDLSSISDKDQKILCVDSITPLSNYDGFKAIITKDNSVNTGDYVNQVTDLDQIQNNTQIVIYNETIYITNISISQTNNSCYYSDPEAPSFLDRLKGTNTHSEQGIASLINVPALPPELRRGTEDYRIDYEYFKEI